MAELSAADRGLDAATDRMGVTARAFCAGIGVALLVNVLPAYSAYIVHSSRMVFAHLPMATMVVFTALAWPLNALLARAKPGWALSQGEMVVVFSMGWIAGAIPAANFMGLFIGGIAAPYYYASPENQWADYLLDGLPKWAAPPNDANQMTWFFEGKPPGVGIPWDAWAAPLAWWGAFLIALAWVSVALMAALRKQWVDRERLPFPLAEAPLAMVDQGEDGTYRLLSSRLFWAGLSIPLSVMAWNIAGYFWHALPPIPLMERWALPLGRGFPALTIKLNFFVLGFAYFTHLDVLFSLWVFYALGIVQTGVFDRLGYSIGASDIWGSRGGAALGWQAMGAFFAFTALSVWMARAHLRDVWRKAMRGAAAVDDSDELLSYRTAVWGMLIGSAFLFFWLWHAGMSALVAAVFLFALILMTVGVTRFVAESGLAYARMPITPQSFTFYTLGIRQMDANSAASLALSYSTFGLGNTFGASTLAHIAQMGARLKLKTRALFWTTMCALVLSLIISAVFTLYLGYMHGAYNFNVYTFNSGNVVIFSNVVKKLQNPFGASPDRLMFFGIGVLLTVLCGVLRYRFLQWPVSPIGLTVFTTGILQRQVFTVFAAWLVKFILLKIGGIGLYRQSLPLFMGLMLGYVLGIGLVFLVDVLFFMGQGHMVHHW